MNNCGESGRERKIKDLAINNRDGNCVCVWARRGDGGLVGLCMTRTRSRDNGMSYVL